MSEARRLVDKLWVPARRWVDAATEVKAQVLEAGGEGVDVARQVGSETLELAKSVAGRISRRITSRPLRRRGDGDVPR
jgi:hypothetical protein